jgi:hypothetical protein
VVALVYVPGNLFIVREKPEFTKEIFLMLLRAFFVMMLALGLAGAVNAVPHNPIPDCLPCPYSR